MLSFKLYYMIEIIIFSFILGIIFSLFDLPQKRVLLFNKPSVKLFVLVVSLFGGLLFVYTISSYPVLAPFLIGYLISYLSIEAIFSRTEVFFLTSLIFFLSYFGLNRVNFVLTLFFVLSYVFDHYFFKQLLIYLKKHGFSLPLRLFLRTHIKKIKFLSEVNFVFLLIVLIYSFFTNSYEVFISSFFIIFIKEMMIQFVSDQSKD